MGYLLSAHIVRHKPDTARLSALPPSIGKRFYYHRAAKVYVIDAFRRDRQPAYPFQSLVPSADIPLELPTKLNDLERIYGYLNKRKLGNSLKKSYINFAMLLNALVNQPVLSFVADDDQLDFACVADESRLSKLHCRAEDLELLFDNGVTQIQPLQPEMDGEEEFLTNLTELRISLPDIAVADRRVPWDAQLHFIAIQELLTFAGINEPILGLGSFDPPEDESELELIVA